MNETFEPLKISCPNCQDTTKHLWKHGEDGGPIQISNHNKLKCIKCNGTCDIKSDECKFACDVCGTLKLAESLLFRAMEYGFLGLIPFVLVKSLKKEQFILLADSIEIEYSELDPNMIELGKGAFKICYKGKVKGKEEEVAIGEINISKVDEKEFWKEVNILRNLHHPNIVCFIKACTSPNYMYIITELCDNGSLDEYMKKTPKPLFKQQVKFMHDIASGVAHLHAQRPTIVHRDLKSPNILISSDLRAKVNDFGVVRINPTEYCSIHSNQGTPLWQAPEMFLPCPSYTGKVDVYACGLIFWEIMTWGKLGYPNLKYLGRLDEKVRIKGKRPLMDTLSAYDSNLLKLTEEMWDGNPSNRPNMATVVRRLSKLL